MPSGWTNSGIDWTSAVTMRNSRTEDIVRHLYLAVNERDYWIRFNSGDIGVLDRIGRLRVDQQLRYIYLKLRSWFKPISEYSGSFTFDNSESIFIDDTITPSDPVSNPEELFYFGYDSYNYLQNGNLETLISEDLGFLRNYGSSTYRVVLDELRIVKKILELDLRNRMFRYSRSGSNYNVIQFPNNATQSMALGFKKGDDEDNPNAPNSSNANALFYSESNIEYTNFISNKFEAFWKVATGNTLTQFIVSQDKHGIKFSPIGYDLNNYKISDFGFKSFSYGFLQSEAFQDDFGILPTTSYTVGHMVIQNDFVDIPSSPIVQFDGEYAFMHQDFVSSGLPVAIRSAPIGQKSVQDSFAIPFLNLNQAGFLNYYTEEAN